MICQGGCNKIRTNEEDFLNITVQIENRSNLDESLESYVDKESLSGVNCDDCGKPAETFKRVVLKNLADTMIFHLKVSCFH
jgi:ubiquitin C-terminal hydrolase